MKYGKLPATDFGPANVYLSAVQAASLPPAPRVFGFGKMFADWGMLGNDRVGDCAFAGSAHETMAWTGIGNRGADAARFTDAGVLADYSALTGYNGNPSTDHGTDVSQLMDYRRTVGLADAAGNRHKLDLAVRFDALSDEFGPGHGRYDWEQFIRATHVFGCVAVGILVPESAQRQFAAHQPWDYVGDENIEGGHYIPAVGTEDSDRRVTVITWGTRQEMTREFFEAYVDELWVPLSREALKYVEGALKLVDWDRVESVARSL